MRTSQGRCDRGLGRRGGRGCATRRRGAKSDVSLGEEHPSTLSTGNTAISLSRQWGSRLTWSGSNGRCLACGGAYWARSTPTRWQLPGAVARAPRDLHVRRRRREIYRTAHVYGMSQATWVRQSMHTRVLRAFQSGPHEACFAGNEECVPRSCRSGDIVSDQSQ